MPWLAPRSRPPEVARDRVRITVAWLSFARRFPFDDLLAPGHAVDSHVPWTA